MKLRAYFVLVSFLSVAVCITLAQTATPNASLVSTQVPRLIKFSGVAQDQTHKPVTGVVGVTFSLYKDQQGGSPLWVETQNVQADASGHYTAMLGSASADGVPLSLFSAAEAHWISTQISGQPEQPRVLLLSVPYALKAEDAETLGGLPASAFMHANASTAPAGAGSKAGTAAAGTVPPANVTGAGTKNFVPMWTGTTTLGNSVIYETGGNVGIGTKTPKAKVDVAGTGTLGIQATVPGTAAAISGIATAVKGGATGVYGQTSDPGGNAVFGLDNATTGGIGVIGESNATSGTSYGVYAATASTSGVGVLGISSATSGSTTGVFGANASSSGSGVIGNATSKTGQVQGVGGFVVSTTTNSAGVVGFESAKTGQVYGVSGGTNSTTNGAAGLSAYEGAATGVVYGVVGSTNSATNFAAGVSGYEGATTGQVNGVVGTSASTSGTGVSGNASAAMGSTNGVYGQSASTTGNGVVGNAIATSGTTFGVQGFSASPSGIGIQANNTSTGEVVALAGPSPYLINAFTSKNGIFTVDNEGNGFFGGNLQVTGKLTKGSGSFKIDHPLDPANKLLSHSFVESPDMMNVYNGNITTDRHGLATVTLPDYFEALNADFRYQLTVIGQFAQAIVARKIAGNRFVIRTNRPNVEVSWQVTGIRHDAYANQFRIPVEEEKSVGERGYYLHPEVFGQPESKSISAAVAASHEVVAYASHN